jgi:hypothetical protein
MWIEHRASKTPVLTFPVGTFWMGVPDDLPSGISSCSASGTTLQHLADPSAAILETTRWHCIITAPETHRVLLALEWLGGSYNATQPEIAHLLCMSLDHLKRALQIHRKHGRVITRRNGVTLVQK